MQDLIQQETFLFEATLQGKSDLNLGAWRKLIDSMDA